LTKILFVAIWDHLIVFDFLQEQVLHIHTNSKP
jgi:hypothetical protein